MRTVQKNIVCAATFAIGGLLAAASYGQEIRGVTIPLGVYDTNNTWLGTYSGTTGSYSFALRPYKGTWYQILFNRVGIVSNAYFYYSAAGCVGQRFLYVSDEVPIVLSFDGTSLWAPSDSSMEQIISARSYGFNGNCYNLSPPSSGIFGVATLVDPAAGTNFVQPFAVR